jgi:predicted transcriptional regulator
MPDQDLTGVSLEDLAVYIRQEHTLAVESVAAAAELLSDGVRHGIIAGTYMMEAKLRMTDGALWQDWLATEVPEISRGLADKYCRWAFYKDKLLATETPIDTGSVTQMLKGLPAVPRFGLKSPDDSTLQQMAALRTEGVSYREIGELTGFNQTTVHQHLNPQQAKKNRDRATRRQLAKKKEERAAQKALERQRRAEVSKKIGGRLDKAYSMAREMAIVIDQAMADYPGDRDVLRQALYATHRAEEQLWDAIRKQV